MPATMQFVTHRISQVREITHDGRRFLVAPVVALRAGVVNGSLIKADELGKFVEAWNGRPVPLGHPQRNGGYVSANSPDIWATETPGMFWNAHMDGDALKGEIWLDLAKAESLGEQALEAVRRLRSNEPIEVSTGYFCDTLDEQGNWNGMQFDGVQMGIRPDHLALLIDGVGACSWDDGCGTPRVNEGVSVEHQDKADTNDFVLEDGDSVTANTETVAKNIFERIVDLIRAQQVEGITPNVEEEGAVEQNEIVAALVANERCKLSKERLEALDADELANLHEVFIGNDEGETEPEVEPEDGQSAEPVTEPASDEMPDWARQLVERVDSIASVVQANEGKEKEALVSELAANETCQFDAGELKAMTVNQLQKLAASLRPRNYTGAAGVFQRNGAGETVLAMPKPAGWGKNGGQE